MRKPLFLLCLIFFIFFRLEKGNAQTAIITYPVIGQITSCQGAQSENQQYQYFIVQGVNLTGPLAVQASAGFLVSTEESLGFQSSINLNEKKGAVLDTIFIRLGPLAPAGNVSGAISLTAAGAMPQTVPVSGTVLPIPVAQPEPNITVLDGTNLPRLNFEGANGNMYMWTNSLPGIGLAASGIDSLPAFRALSNSDTTVTATITITPVLAGTAYVTNAESNTISVINTLTNAIDTTISSGGKHPTSETLSPDRTRLFVLNYIDTSISIFNTANNQLIRNFPLAQTLYPYQIATNHDGTLLYVLTYGLGYSSVWNTQTGKLVTIFPTKGVYLSEIAFTPSGNQFYIGSDENGFQGMETLYNTATNAPVLPILVPVFNFRLKKPPQVIYQNMVFSPDSTRLYVGDTSQVSIINTLTHQVIGTVPIIPGAGDPRALAISPDGKYLYAIVDFVGTANQVQVFNTATNKLVQIVTIPTGISSGLCVSPDGTRLYVSSIYSNQVAVVNTETYQVITYITVGSIPQINTFCVKQGGCFGNPITFTITINPAPVPSIFTSTDTLKALTTVYGTPSASESFTVSGKLLRTAVTLAASPDFEISLDNSNFSSTATIGAYGTLAATTLYVRLAASDMAGVYTGNILLTSAGAGNANVFIPKSTVTPASLVITANNKTKVLDAPNPALTTTYQGFEDGDTPASLVYPPALNTTALTDSPVGTYPIAASNAYSPNYNISYIQGVLTITPDIIIPNTFTPNGDGINDTWDIQKINNYPDCSVQVFSRYGNLVYSSTGYNIPWDGTYKGSMLPTGTYYYIINLYAGIPLLSGFVAIIR